MLWASMPSPSPRVGAILTRLSRVCDLEVDEVQSTHLPQIISLSSLSLPLPLQYVYVGSGCKSFPVKPSPWLNPFSQCPSGGLELYRTYVKSRPDLQYFVNAIAKARTIVCDCSTVCCECHASVLVEIICELLHTGKNVVQESPQDDVVIQDLDSICMDCTSDSGDDEDPVDEYDEDELTANGLEQVNETVRACAIGERPAYPPVWSKLIAHVRSFQILLFWEIFAGCAVLIDCMQEQGWTCAAPLDILIHPDFDLLNPMFMAIVLGLILEGRFGVVHLGPPCSSFSMAVNRFKKKKKRG